MDKTNSQLKSSNASVGTNKPIELPRSHGSRKKHSQPDEPIRQPQAIPTEARQENLSQDEPARRSRRYYDDSDDMIDRVRRVRAAFEKRVNGFQGADWPHYLKRTIIGKKKAEALTPAESSPAEQISGGETSTVNLRFPPERPGA